MNDNLSQIFWLQETTGVQNLDAFFMVAPDRFMMLSMIWRSMRDYYRRGVWG